MNNDQPCWTPCDMCEDYICNIHEMHAHDCVCKPIEWWYDRDMAPYTTTVQEYFDKTK